MLWSSCLAMLAVGANSTAIMAALPTMRTELLLSSAGVQWAVNAYLVAAAACIVLGGEMADRFGARLASMVGLALFGVASCVIALPTHKLRCWRDEPYKALAQRSRCPALWLRSTPVQGQSAGQQRPALGPGS